MIKRNLIVSQSQGTVADRSHPEEKTRRNKTNMQYNMYEYFHWLIKKCKITGNSSPSISGFLSVNKQYLEGSL
jgi:hypothetical protein